MDENPYENNNKWETNAAIKISMTQTMLILQLTSSTTRTGS